MAPAARRFYLALVAYPLATASMAFYYRYLSGQSDDPLYPEMETVVPALVEHAHRVIDGARRSARSDSHSWPAAMMGWGASYSTRMTNAPPKSSG